MASSRKPARRTFADHFQATFGRRLEARKLRSRTLLAMGVVAVLSTGAASADWRVYDNDVERVLKEIKAQIGDNGKVNDHLDKINDRLAITDTEFKPTAESTDDPKLVIPQDPSTGADSSKLNSSSADARDKPSSLTGATGPTGAPITKADRCPNPKAPGVISNAQKTVCEEIYDTELAKYRFSLEMYEVAQKRNEKLQELITERNSYAEEDFGKMEENSNKLLALQVQMDNDRDRYQTYMQAYEARMAYLDKSKQALADQVMNGKPSLLGSAIGGVALVTALERLANTGRRSVEDDNIANDLD